MLAIDQLGCAARSKFGVRGNIARLGNVVFMARNQHAILRRHQIGLNEIGAIANRAGIRGERVFGPPRTSAAMPQYDRLGRARWGPRAHYRRPHRARAGQTAKRCPQQMAARQMR